MFNKLVILGCGLIGCSIAGAAKEKKIASQIVGIEVRNLQAVRNLGFFDEVRESVLDVDSADLVVISTPISSLSDVFFDLVDQHFKKDFGLITDVLSTKKSLIEIISSLSSAKKKFFLKAFLSSHPLAGSEKNGAAAADIKIFDNSKVLICPLDLDFEVERNTNNKQKNKEKKMFNSLENFWSSLGGQPKTLPISEHDRFFACVSHFPHLVVFCLAYGLSQSDFSSQALSLHGGGLKDTTRIAGASPDLWSDIIFDNKDEMLNLITQWTNNWENFANTLKNSDKRKFKELLAKASSWRNSFEIK